MDDNVRIEVLYDLSDFCESAYTKEEVMKQAAKMRGSLNYTERYGLAEWAYRYPQLNCQEFAQAVMSDPMSDVNFDLMVHEFALNIGYIDVLCGFSSWVSDD